MHNKQNREVLNHKVNNIDELTNNSELFNTKAIKQDISISHFQIYLINKGNKNDPREYKYLYHLVDQDGDYNYLANLIADENEVDIYYQGSNYGRRNLLEVFFALRNHLRLDVEGLYFDEILLYIFLHNNYLVSSIDIKLINQLLIVKYQETDKDALLTNIFSLYGLKLKDFNYEELVARNDNLHIFDLNNICDKINI